MAISFIDSEAVSKAADEITAQASTIARLEARVAELESGRGEQVKTPDMPYKMLPLEEDGWFQCVNAYEAMYPLFTAPPAPVAVVLPERKPVTVGLLSESNTHNQGWNACLDATAALNGPKS